MYGDGYRVEFATKFASAHHRSHERNRLHSHFLHKNIAKEIVALNVGWYILLSMVELKTIDKHISSLMNQIIESASKQDIPTIQRLLRKADELQEMKENLTAIQLRLTNLGNKDLRDTAIDNGRQLSAELRKLLIEVTEGDIRQNLLKLTPHIKRGKVRTGEELTIEAIPSGERFRTVVSDKGNKLRSRGEIARFYRDAKVSAGDFVSLTEEAPGCWALKKAAPGEFPNYP